MSVQEIKGGTATVKRHSGPFISKLTTRFLDDGVVDREEFWLRKMHGEPRTPDLLGRDGNKIFMTDVGEPLCHGNAPGNWKKQVDDVLDTLVRHKCCHNDIRPDNIMVQGGQIRLIDFQWATEMGEETPSRWPALGGVFCRPGPGYDDAFSLQACFESVL